MSGSASNTKQQAKAIKLLNGRGMFTDNTDVMSWDSGDLNVLVDGKNAYDLILENNNELATPARITSSGYTGNAKLDNFIFLYKQEVKLTSVNLLAALKTNPEIATWIINKQPALVTEDHLKATREVTDKALLYLVTSTLVNNLLDNEDIKTIKRLVSNNRYPRVNPWSYSSYSSPS